MRDVFPLPPIPALSAAVQPLSDYLGFDVLPLHIHQVLYSALFYTLVQVVISPVLSHIVVPHIYGPMSHAKKVSWNTHVVSLVQSLIINGLSLWCIFADQERKNMDFDWKERIWGYSGTPGMVAALACGYFIWDLGITVLNFSVFGPGVLSHAVSALAVFSFGFVRHSRPLAPLLFLRENRLTPCRDPSSTTMVSTSSSTSCPRLSSTCTGSLTSST